MWKRLTSTPFRFPSRPMTGEARSAADIAAGTAARRRRAKRLQPTHHSPGRCQREQQRWAAPMLRGGGGTAEVVQPAAFVSPGHGGSRGYAGRRNTISSSPLANGATIPIARLGSAGIKPIAQLFTTGVAHLTVACLRQARPKHHWWSFRSTAHLSEGF